MHTEVEKALAAGKSETVFTKTVTLAAVADVSARAGQSQKDKSAAARTASIEAFPTRL